jgi:glyoxalase family protein
MQLHGLHHVTAVTGQAAENVRFYTQVLGLRLVKKTVNQDDVSAYHLFYADKLGSPGTDMTFFDWPQTGPNRHGADSIAMTAFRVSGRAALDYWAARFDTHGVPHEPVESLGGHDVLRFEDMEGQRLMLVDDQGADFHGEVWDEAGIPADSALRGFYGVVLSVPRLDRFEPILTQLLDFERVGQFPALDDAEETITVYAMDGGGPGKEVWVLEQPRKPIQRLGYGGVHHVAFRVSDDGEQRAWNERLQRIGVGTSGVVDRFYFKSLYFRVSNGILFELATDGPGFAADEPLESLGEKLALPPFLEPSRAQIEAGLKPL